MSEENKNRCPKCDNYKLRTLENRTPKSDDLKSTNHRLDNQIFIFFIFYSIIQFRLMHVTIAKYQLIYYVLRPGTLQRVTRIKIYDDRDRNFVNLFFYKEGHPVPNNPSFVDMVSNTNTHPDGSSVMTAYRLNLSENYLDRIVDMSRNEKPCLADLSGSISYLYT